MSTIQKAATTSGENQSYWIDSNRSPDS